MYLSIYLFIYLSIYIYILYIIASAGICDVREARFCLGCLDQAYKLQGHICIAELGGADPSNVWRLVSDMMVT